MRDPVKCPVNHPPIAPTGISLDGTVTDYNTYKPTPSTLRPSTTDIPTMWPTHGPTTIPTMWPTHRPTAPTAPRLGPSTTAIPTMWPTSVTLTENNVLARSPTIKERVTSTPSMTEGVVLLSGLTVSMALLAAFFIVISVWVYWRHRQKGSKQDGVTVETEVIEDEPWPVCTQTMRRARSTTHPVSGQQRPSEFMVELKQKVAGINGL